jgi:hypothetical protein
VPAQTLKFFEEGFINFRELGEAHQATNFLILFAEENLFFCTNLISQGSDNVINGELGQINKLMKLHQSLSLAIRILFTPGKIDPHRAHQRDLFEIARQFTEVIFVLKGGWR